MLSIWTKINNTKSGFTTPLIVIASEAKQSQRLGDCFASLAMTDKISLAMTDKISLAMTDKISLAMTDKISLAMTDKISLAMTDKI